MKSDWEQTQERQITDHRKGADVFSDEKRIGAVMVGSLLQKLIPGKSCLDVGCGILPLPGYMKHAPSVRFTGVDPMDGEKRKFSFVQCRAEELPFADQEFDAVLFATSIDHVEFPDRAVGESFRVLKSGGYLILWGSFRDEADPKYIKWKQTRSLKLYNHPQVFSLKSIGKLMKGLKLVSTINIQNSEKVLIYQK